MIGRMSANRCGKHNVSGLTRGALRNASLCRYPLPVHNASPRSYHARRRAMGLCRGGDVYHDQADKSRPHRPTGTLDRSSTQQAKPPHSLSLLLLRTSLPKQCVHFHQTVYIPLGDNPIPTHLFSDRIDRDTSWCMHEG